MSILPHESMPIETGGGDRTTALRIDLRQVMQMRRLIDHAVDEAEDSGISGTAIVEAIGQSLIWKLVSIEGAGAAAAYLRALADEAASTTTLARAHKDRA